MKLPRGMFHQHYKNVKAFKKFAFTYIALFLAEEFLKVEEALEKVEEALAHLNICLTYPFIPKKKSYFCCNISTPSAFS